MNLNPLFFDKLTNDAGLYNALNSSNPETTHLFADIINVFTEDNPAEVKNSNTVSLDQLLANINDLEITIPVNHEVLEKLAGIIDESCSGENLLSRDLYHLEEINITTTKQSINEEELIAFVEGLQNLLNNRVYNISHKLENANLPENLDPEYDKANSDSIMQTISLETINSALVNHDAVKFVLVSGGDKISLQISGVEKNIVPMPNEKLNSLKILSELPTYQENPKAETDIPSLQDSFNIPNDSQKPGINGEVSVNSKDRQGADVNSNQSGVVNHGTEKEDTLKLYRIEVIQAETSKKTDLPVPKHKGPFILDIKTSKEISSFLSKYNYDEVESKIYQNQSESFQDKLNNTNSSEVLTEVNKDVDEISLKESRLVLVDGKKVDKQYDQLKTERINGAEYLRAIKIESSGRVTELNASGPKAQEIQSAVVEEDNSAQGKKLVESNPILVKKVIVQNEGNIITGNRESDSGNTKVNDNPANDSSKPEPGLIKKEPDNFDNGELFNPNEEGKPDIEKSHPRNKENIDQFSGIETDIETESSSHRGSEGDHSESSGSISDNKDFSKVDTPKDSEQIVKNDSGVKINHESIKPHEAGNTATFEKGVNKIENNPAGRIISEAGMFSESVKNIKSNEIISEINKYLQTNEKQSITFHLSPKDLGTVKLIVDYAENNLQARIEVDNEQVKQTIQSNLDQLKNNLQSSGINVSSININLSSGESRAQKSFTGKRKSYSGQSGPGVERGDDLSGTKKMGYNTYEFLA